MTDDKINRFSVLSKIGLILICLLFIGASAYAAYSDHDYKQVKYEDGGEEPSTILWRHNSQEIGVGQLGPFFLSDILANLIDPDDEVAGFITEEGYEWPVPASAATLEDAFPFDINDNNEIVGALVDNTTDIPMPRPFYCGQDALPHDNIIKVESPFCSVMPSVAFTGLNNAGEIVGVMFGMRFEDMGAVQNYAPAYNKIEGSLEDLTDDIGSTLNGFLNYYQSEPVTGPFGSIYQIVGNENIESPDPAYKLRVFHVNGLEKVSVDLEHDGQRIMPLKILLSSTVAPVAVASMMENPDIPEEVPLAGIDPGYLGGTVIYFSGDNGRLYAYNLHSALFIACFCN